MKILKLPASVSAFLFDMDMTLYTHPEYAQFQIDSPVRRLARRLGFSFEEMGEAIAAYRRGWADTHGGQSISLGNVFTAFGVSIAESIRWREELYEPTDYLGEDPRLREALLALSPPPGRAALSGTAAALVVVTNNPVSIAEKTLSALGVADLFTAIVGLDTCGVSKPHEAPFRRAAELAGVPPANCVSVGDRYDIDIAVPLELGMGGILVDGVEDVYRLPDLLKITGNE
ncbi:MAG: HAD family hydrolase [Spirochaetaceae bacterium]|jgi:phosphoglycolate phosphatase/putative hydrolase of the HAD superfamily|nr:HAD family hydrolase [Spirochaetaceae bacterium]